MNAQLVQSVIGFASMAVAIATFMRARDESSRKSSVEVANLSFKIDSLAEKMAELASAQRLLVDGYTSNEKRITILEHRVAEIEKSTEER